MVDREPPSNRVPQYGLALLSVLGSLQMAEVLTVDQSQGALHRDRQLLNVVHFASLASQEMLESDLFCQFLGSLYFPTNPCHALSVSGMLILLYNWI